MYHEKSESPFNLAKLKFLKRKRESPNNLQHPFYIIYHLPQLSKSEESL